MIEGEPDAPAMMVKRDGEGECDYQEDRNHYLIVGTDHSHGQQVTHQYCYFSRNNIDENCSNEESLFAFEVHLAGVASVLDLKRFLNY